MVGLLTGCVQQVFFPGVNEATVRILAAEGCDVVIPRKQGCCGALSLHSGRATEAAGFARRTMTAFEDAGVDVVVVNSAGCGSAMKEYTHLFGGDGDEAPRAERFTSQVRDLSEFLAELAADGGPRAVRHPLPVTAVYHEACHLGHAQGIRRQPRDLLREIPGLELVEPSDPGTCCGSAGVYNLLQPEAAGELGARKAASVLATGAPLVISANPGCSLQISAAMAAAGSQSPPAMAHIAEVLDASLRGAPVTELTGRAGAGDAGARGRRRRPASGPPASPGRVLPRPRSPRARSASWSRPPVSPAAAPPGTVTCHWRGAVFVAEKSSGCCCRSRDRAGTTGARLARAPLVHPHADGVRPGPPDQFHVAAVREVRRVQAGRRGQVELVQRVVHQAGQVRVADADPQAVPDHAADHGPSRARGRLTGPMSTVIWPSGSARTWRIPDRVATANDGPAARPCSSR